MGLMVSSGIDDTGFKQRFKNIASLLHRKSKHNSTSPFIPLPSLQTTLSVIGMVAALVACDVYRTVNEMGARVALASQVAALELASRGIDLARPAAPFVPSSLGDDAYFATLSPNGDIVASNAPGLTSGMSFEDPALGSHAIWAKSPVAEGAGEVAIVVPYTAVFGEPMLRGGLWLLLALGTMVVLGRRQAQQREAQTLLPADTLQTAIDAAPFGLARWTADGKLLCASAGLPRLLKLEDLDVVPGLAYEEITRRIAGRINTCPVLDKSCQRMVEVERADGTTILIDERPCPEGGFITIVTNVTERKRADRMLASIREDQKALARQYHEEKIRAEAASRAKTSFLAHLSHDIRTPLNHIIGFADLIAMETYGPLGDCKYKTYLKDIRLAGERLLTSFAEILEYAELEGGQKELKHDPIVMRDLVSQTASRFSSRAARAGVELTVSEAAPGLLWGDRHCLNRMLDNLVDNAIRFTPRGGEVRLAAWAAEDGVVLEVSDTGVGIPADHLSLLSQPFLLSDAMLTRDHEGVGLGIAIARTIAELSGGRIAIDSTPDVGTTVAILLPTPSQDRDDSRIAA